MIFPSERCRIFTMKTVILKESRSSGADALGMSAGITQLVKSNVFLLCVSVWNQRHCCGAIFACTMNMCQSRLLIKS